MTKTTQTLDKVVLGALLNPMSTARTMMQCERCGVNKGFFTTFEAKQVWAIVENLWRTHNGVDEALVRSAVKDEPAVALLVNQCVAAAPFPSMAPQVVEAFAREHLQSLALQVAQQLHNDAVALGGQEAIAKAEAAMVAFHDTESSIYGSCDEETRETEEILAEYELLHQKRVVERDSSFFIGRQLPWSVLNLCYTGVKPGIHIIAARPSQGKTALAVTMSAGMAAKGVKQLFFSLDMPRKELRKRFGSLLGNVSLSRLELGGTREEVAQMRKGMKLFESLGSPTREKENPIRIKSAYHIDRIIGDIYRAVKCEGVQCVWVDYLQLVSSSKQGTLKEQIDDVLTRLKQCAVDLKIPIFCLCQLNRDTGKDPYRKPNLTDLGDSGKIERDASTVLVLWTDQQVREAWDQYPPLPLAGGNETLAKVIEPVWLLLLKNQQGARRNFPFLFYKNTFMFRPANHEACAIVQEENGKQRKDNRPFFSQLRDDFIILEKPNGTGLDDRIKKSGALGKRGL